MSKIIHRSFIGISITLIMSLLVAIVWVALNWLLVLDKLTILVYEPSPQIQALATDSFMSPKGRDIFYVTDPMINQSAEFNINCDFPERSLILGCYDGLNIFIFDVEGSTLEGVEEVTSAHEMLHAAYVRLSEKDRKTIDRALDTQLEKIDDERIVELVASYRANDEESIHTEMHSIFGTEVYDVGGELEAHYEQYFSDRQSLVSVSESYESVFSKLIDRTDILFDEIEDLRTTLLDQEDRLTPKSNAINAMESELERHKSDIEVAKNNNNRQAESSSVSAHNSLVASLQIVIDDYNVLVNSYNTNSKDINRMTKEYNEIAAELGRLTSSISSKLQETL